MKDIELLKEALTREALKAEWGIKGFELQSPHARHRDGGTAASVEFKSFAFVAGLHPIILAELGEDLKEARTIWAAAQREAAAARTTVAADGGEDLVLILVGPPGSQKKGEWQSFAMEVERNDLVCRKLVWLPPEESIDREGSLNALMLRSFLSKPWVPKSASPQTELDALSEPNADLLGWQDILDDQPLNRADVDYDMLVKELIQAHKS